MRNRYCWRVIRRARNLGPPQSMMPPDGHIMRHAVFMFRRGRCWMRRFVDVPPHRLCGARGRGEPRAFPNTRKLPF